MPSYPCDLPSWKALISEYEQRGDLFKAYDTAIEAMGTLPDEIWLQHRAVLSLANAGATSQAEKKYFEFHLNERCDTESSTLLGRILKQRAYEATPNDQVSIFRMAIAVYQDAWQRSLITSPEMAYYPGINVATLHLLVGEIEEARQMAFRVLGLLAPVLDQTDTSAVDRYWILASAIEAHLILKQIDDARTLARQAKKLAGEDFINLASTARQLNLISECHGLDLNVFDFVVQPEVLHYTGHMPGEVGKSGRLSLEDIPRISAAIEAELQPLCIAAAYGSLAAGSDILFAEAILRKGVKLNVVLPFNIKEFLDISVRPFGQDWVNRFEACIGKALTVRYATTDQHLGDDNLFLYCSQLAMGLTVLCARHLSGTVRQIAVWDGLTARGAAGTAQDMQIWKGLGQPQTIIRCGREIEGSLDLTRSSTLAPIVRRNRAMLFADFKGFSKLGDASVRVFSTLVMGNVADVFDRCADGLDFINTWGDGIFAVYEDPVKAANAALVLQAAIGDLDFESAGLPSTLALRLGGHLAPVFEVHDPVMKRRTFMGVHVNLAARIEPITPEGCVYVTEPFAAALAIHKDRQFSCDYVGVTDMAKSYGAMRMFLLSRSRAIERGPAQLKFLP